MIELVGQKLGKYDVQEHVGGGGMADVYRCYDSRLRRSVALKVPKPERIQDPAFAEAFANEAIMAANLSHPCIVTIHDVGELDGVPFIVMEYVPGRNLKDLVRARGRLPLNQVSRLFGQVAEALEYAHGRGFVHCDIKPGNILVAPGGQTKLTDFGIARAVTRAREGGPQKKLVGTPRYMSPEHVQRKALDQRSDVYSLGVVLFELLTGRVPFDKGSSSTVARAHVAEPPPAPSSVNSSLPKGVDDIVLRALAKDPGQRYQDVLEMARDLRRVLSEPAPVRPRRRVWGVVAVLAGLAGVVAAFQILPVPDNPDETPTAPTATASATEGQTGVGETVIATSTPTPPGGPTSTLGVRGTSTMPETRVQATSAPTSQPTTAPTNSPVPRPTSIPTEPPAPKPTTAPTSPPPPPPEPTTAPTRAPEPTATSAPPTRAPTSQPTAEPQPTR